MSGLAEAGPLWLVGCGNMGGAMLNAWRAAGLADRNVLVIDPAGRAIDGVRFVAVPPPGEQPAILVLGVKPQILDAVVPVLAPCVGAGTQLISILAGVDVGSLRDRFPNVAGIARLMPNLAAMIGQGVTLLHADAGADRELAEALARAAGHAEWLDDETLFDAGTALSGCGPAFLFRFIDALAGAGRDLGLAPDVAARLALATVDGAARFAAVADTDPATLADRVASPGGATREGLNVLDRRDGLRPLLDATLGAAAQRSRELAQAARAG